MSAYPTTGNIDVDHLVEVGSVASIIEAPFSLCDLQRSWVLFVGEKYLETKVRVLISTKVSLLLGSLTIQS